MVHDPSDPLLNQLAPTSVGVLLSNQMISSTQFTRYGVQAPWLGSYHPFSRFLDCQVRPNCFTTRAKQVSAP